MYRFEVEYWRLVNDGDDWDFFHEEVEARNAEEACEILISREPEARTVSAKRIYKKK